MEHLQSKPKNNKPFILTSNQFNAPHRRSGLETKLRIYKRDGKKTKGRDWIEKIANNDAEHFAEDIMQGVYRYFMGGDRYSAKYVFNKLNNKEVYSKFIEAFEVLATIKGNGKNIHSKAKTLHLPSNFAQGQLKNIDPLSAVQVFSLIMGRNDCHYGNIGFISTLDTIATVDFGITNFVPESLVGYIPSQPKSSKLNLGDIGYFIPKNHLLDRNPEGVLKFVNAIDKVIPWVRARQKHMLDDICNRMEQYRTVFGADAFSHVTRESIKAKMDENILFMQNLAAQIEIERGIFDMDTELLKKGLRRKKALGLQDSEADPVDRPICTQTMNEKKEFSYEKIPDKKFNTKFLIFFTNSMQNPESLLNANRLYVELQELIQNVKTVPDDDFSEEELQMLAICDEIASEKASPLDIPAQPTTTTQPAVQPATTTTQSAVQVTQPATQKPNSAFPNLEYVFAITCLIITHYNRPVFISLAAATAISSTSVHQSHLPFAAIASAAFMTIRATMSHYVSNSKVATLCTWTLSTAVSSAERCQMDDAAAFKSLVIKALCCAAPVVVCFSVQELGKKFAKHVTSEQLKWFSVIATGCAVMVY